MYCRFQGLPLTNQKAETLHAKAKIQLLFPNGKYLLSWRETNKELRPTGILIGSLSLEFVY